MSALIPALINLLMSRMKGGGGGGGGRGGAGGGKQPESDYDKDEKYWNKELMKMPQPEDEQRASDARIREMNSRPIPSL
jgi:hypothetical protein